MRELGGNANGEGALIMSGGSIQNILLEIIALDLQEALGQWISGDKSKVEVLCLAMPTRIESGRFRAQPWILDTTDAIVTVTGYVDLGSEQVDIELKPYPKDFSLFNYLTSIEITGDLSERQAETSPLEAVGKLVLKTLVAPVMPLLSEEIQETAQERSVPCPSLRQRLEAALADDDVSISEATEEAARAESEGGAPQQEPTESSEDEAAQQEPPPASQSATDAETISRVQSALNKQGFDLTVDGVLGPRTEAALKDFQQRSNLPPSGRPNPRTLRQLGLLPE
jgi:hypothetical protein